MGERPLDEIDRDSLRQIAIVLALLVGIVGGLVVVITSVPITVVAVAALVLFGLGYAAIVLLAG